MNLDQVTANIRLRSVWEAVDLGFVMVQEWWKAIYTPLIILTTGITVTLFYLIPENYYGLGVLIFWWLKPLYDRLVLHIISHKLFNDELTSAQALKALPMLIWNSGLFQSLTFRRFSLSRGFNLPIWQLEQLRGPERAGRQRVLHVAAHSQAVWLTLCLWFLEIILYLSLFALLIMFLPQQMRTDFLANLFNQSTVSVSWLDFLKVYFYVVVVTFIHPFYIAANFSLYINRRTQLEAWDIELEFRKMAQRFRQQLQTSLPALLLAILLTVFIAPTSSLSADEPKNKHTSDDITEVLSTQRKSAVQAKQVIQEVMLSKNLNDKKTVKRWIKKKKVMRTTKDTSAFRKIIETFLEPFAKLFATLFESSLWILLTVGVILIYFYRGRWLPFFQHLKHHEEKYIAPEIMFGMDVRPDSLPHDIISAARQLWQQNQHREALSLLYRGALVRLINNEKIQLENSDTEGDVLNKSARKLPDNKQHYLQSLTRHWQTIAYAHRVPENAAVQTLFDHWKTDFSVKTTPAANNKAPANAGGPAQ